MKSLLLIGFIGFLLFCTSCPAVAEELDKIRVSENGQFIDSFGRLRLFHGINSVLKGFPYYDDSLLDSQILDYYKDWGFNFLRLGCMWSGVYPQENSLNQTYVNILKSIVNETGNRGMYTLLDMHQDVISTKFDAYDGVPRWLIDKFPEVPSALKFPWPFKKSGGINSTNWFEYYLTYEVGNAFQDIYQNSSSSWNYWSQFWMKIAENFRDKNSIMGYELINEPWAGNIYTNPLRLIPGYAGRYNLLPVYDYLVKSIREIDSRTLIFYEPVTWGYYLPGKDYPGTGFDHIPGGNEERFRSVLSYHYYCWLLNAASPTNPYPHWEQIVCDEGFAHQVFTSVLKDQNDAKMGLFLTEFGLCAPDGHNTSINTIECGVMLQLSDNYLQSWAYWDSQFFDDSSKQTKLPIWDRVKYFARVYPQATAGQPSFMHFDVEKATFLMQYQLNTTIAAPTEIFLPLKVHYGGSANNVQVNIDPSGVVDYEIVEAENKLFLRQSSECDAQCFADVDGTIITVSVLKRQ